LVHAAPEAYRSAPEIQTRPGREGCTQRLGELLEAVMSEAELLIWTHLMAMAGYFGVQLAVLYMLLPAAARAPNEPGRRAILINGFKFYNPFTIAMLGLIVMSGAIHLTDLKASMKMEYFARIGAALELKLLLAFLLIFIQTYITFGLAFRIGRQEEVAAHGDGEPFSAEKIDRLLSRIRAMIFLTIALTAGVVLVSIRMASDAEPAVPVSAAALARVHLTAITNSNDFDL
jgi:uncharacterized membrane protein